jgi:hypothetical protein
MSFRKIFFALCLIISVFCLAAGYSIVGQWIGVIIAILTGPAWLRARKYPASQMPFICLLLAVGLAVAGTLLGSPALLMIFASAMALAVWDLLLLDSALGNHSSAEQTRKYENRHLRSLLLALTSGLFAAWLGHSLNFQIPFFLLLLLVALMVFALDRIWGALKKTAKL